MFRLRKHLLFKLISACIGLFLSLVFLELFLRISGDFFAPEYYKNSAALNDKIIVFAGDSWTHGADADAGKSFFSLLEADNDFKKFSLVNVGYGGNNCFQVVNAIIGYGRRPDIVIVNFGVNCWHLMGVGEFINNAKNYLSAQEVSQLCKDLKFYDKWAWFMSLKIYRLYCYIAHSRPKNEEITLKEMDDKLGSELFWKMLINFRETYQDYGAQYQALPQLLKEAKGLSLDQKFYFTALHLGFASEGAEAALRKAGIFYPERLRVIPYDAYRNIGVAGKQLDDTRTLFMKWSFKLLKEWALRNNATVFIQTYPDIKKENQGENSFDKLNELLKSFSYDNGFMVIDHNVNGINWKKYRTCWHVNNEGHKLMRDNIKSYLLRNTNIFRDEKENPYH